MSTLQNTEYKICQQALAEKDGIESGFVRLSSMLHAIKKEQLYMSGWESWEEYCMEFKGMSQRTLDKLVQVYQVYVVENKMKHKDIQKAGGWSLLAETLPYVKSPEDAREWIEKSNILSLRDIRKELKEAKTGVDTTKCQHKKTYTVEVCEDCGERWRIYET